MLTYDLSKRKTESIYLYLSEQIKNDIKSGVLKVGQKLPSKRNLAEHLGISVITVETAYETLISEGYVYSVEKKWIFYR